MGGFAYWWRSHTASVVGETRKTEHCVNGSEVFSYTMRRGATGAGHSPLLLADGTAALKAQQSAYNLLDKKLQHGSDFVPYPPCGFYQPAMVDAMRERMGARFDPNRFAADRVTTPPDQTWAAACRAHSIEAFLRFEETWPMWSDAAHARMCDLCRAASDCRARAFSV